MKKINLEFVKNAGHRLGISRINLAVNQQLDNKT